MHRTKACFQCQGTGLFTTFQGGTIRCVICKGRGLVNQSRYEEMVDYWYGRALLSAEDPISTEVRDRKLDELDAWWHDEELSAATIDHSSVKMALNCARRAA